MTTGNSANWPPPKPHCHSNYSWHFADFQLYQVTLPIDPPYNTATTTTVNISQISALPGNTADWPPLQHCHYNYSLHFSYFQLYQVTLPINPTPNPPTTLPWQLQLTFFRFQLYQVTLLIYIQIPQTDMRKSQFYLGTYI